MSLIKAAVTTEAMLVVEERGTVLIRCSTVIGTAAVREAMSVATV
jgi:hypothetical protein